MAGSALSVAQWLCLAGLKLAVQPTEKWLSLAGWLLSSIPVYLSYNLLVYGENMQASSRHQAAEIFKQKYWREASACQSVSINENTGLRLKVISLKAGPSVGGNRIISAYYVSEGSMNEEYCRAGEEIQ
jgi:hypothetical protein